jgi:hypothetical protein
MPMPLPVAGVDKLERRVDHIKMRPEAFGNRHASYLPVTQGHHMLDITR